MISFPSQNFRFGRSTDGVGGTEGENFINFFFKLERFLASPTTRINSQYGFDLRDSSTQTEEKNFPTSQAIAFRHGQQQNENKNHFLIRRERHGNYSMSLKEFCCFAA